MIDLTQIKKVHCIGIGGIGLSAIADILLARGYEVTGSDMNQSAKVEKLMDDGITVYLGHRAKNVEGADLVVYTVALADDNPELVRARELGIPCITRGKMLGLLMRESKTSIAISGTHGKTTTTAMISLVMKHAGLDPTIAVGGNLEELGGNVAVGSDQYFVAEACEYRDSFLELHPNIEVILNIDSDHLDYFKDIEHIVRSFEKFVSLLPEDGLLFAYDANPFVKRVIKGRDNVITFGMSQDMDVYPAHFDRGYSSFDVYCGHHFYTHVDLRVLGRHNCMDALSAIAAAWALGVEPEAVTRGLTSFTGAARRMEFKGTYRGADIYDDYAHHPGELKATLDAVPQRGYSRTIVVFQPHTYSRTKALFSEFVEQLSRPDLTILADIYAAREQNTVGISSKDVADAIPRAEFYPSFDEITARLREIAAPGDLILTIGAGDIYKVGEALAELGQ